MPIGRGFRYYGNTPPWYRVSAVATDVLARRLRQAARLARLLPDASAARREAVGRADRDEPRRPHEVGERDGAARRPSRASSPSSNPRGPTANATLMDTLVAKSMARRTFTMMLLGIAAAMALLLSVVGLYGVLSYVVGQRRGEIAIRMALGAQVAQVSRMVVGQSLRLARARRGDRRRGGTGVHARAAVAAVRGEAVGSGAARRVRTAPARRGSRRRLASRATRGVHRSGRRVAGRVN